MTIYISLAVSATMFPESGLIEMQPRTPDEVKAILASSELHVESALNPSHASTIEVIRQKYDIALPIPERAPKVLLDAGDSVIIIQAQLPRLNEGEVHSAETVQNAKISFREWSLLSV